MIWWCSVCKKVRCNANSGKGMTLQMNIFERMRMGLAILLMRKWFDYIIAERDNDDNVLAIVFCKDGSDYLIEEE